MADFAKAQLLKYGWTEGKGLGKNESGISEAIKPKLKFDTAGIGHDSAEQFTYHWWENVFNEAAKNISVKSDSHGVSMKVIDEDTVDITTKKSSLKALKKSNKIQYGNFLKTSTLLNDGKLVSENPGDSVTENTIGNKINHVQLTDEDLFKACGGRTAHKGARHGLNLNGKLARIAEQEKQLLAKMNLGKEERIETDNPQDSSHDFTAVKSRKRVKSKRKKLIKEDPESATNYEEPVSQKPVNELNPQPSCSYTIDPDAEENLDALKSKQKTKKSKKNNCKLVSPGYSFENFISRNNSEEDQGSSSGCNTTRSNQVTVDNNANTVEQDEEFLIPPLTEEPVQRTRSKKGRRKERRKINDLTEQLDSSCVIEPKVQSDISDTKIERAEWSKKRLRAASQEIVEESLYIASEEFGLSARKYIKLNADEISERDTSEVDRLNAKILRKKRHALEKRRRDKLDSITKELMSVNLDENCKESKTSNKKNK